MPRFTGRPYVHVLTRAAGAARASLGPGLETTSPGPGLNAGPPPCRLTQPTRDEPRAGGTVPRTEQTYH